MDEMTNPEQEVIENTADEAAVPGQADEHDNSEVDNDADAGLGEEPTEADDETEEVEIDGKVYALPKGLKDQLMMHRDYTQKTQNLAEERRAEESRREVFRQHQERVQANLQSHARFVALSDQLAQYDQLNWAELSQEDPAQAQQLWFQKEQLRQARDQLGRHISEEEQRLALEQQHSHAKRIEEGRAVLAREIPGWGPELQGKLAAFGEKFFGGTDALSKAIDPYNPHAVKLLNLARIGFEASEKARAKPAEATKVKPVTKVQPGKAQVAKDPAKMTDAEWFRQRQREKQRQR